MLTLTEMQLFFLHQHASSIWEKKYVHQTPACCGQVYLLCAGTSAAVRDSPVNLLAHSLGSGAATENVVPPPLQFRPTFPRVSQGSCGPSGTPVHHP